MPEMLQPVHNSLPIAFFFWLWRELGGGRGGRKGRSKSYQETAGRATYQPPFLRKNG